MSVIQLSVTQLKARLCWFYLIFLFPVLPANASIPLANYFNDTWSTQDGLPHNSINAIAQTTDGYLWFATWEGVARYNGREFRFYERSDKTGIVDSGTRALVSDDQNGLWVAGARGGITYHKDTKWYPQPVAKNMVNHVLKDSEGGLWIATEGLGVFHRPHSINQGQQDSESWYLENTSAYRLLEDKQSQIWAATEKGLFRLDKNASHTPSTNKKYEDVFKQNGLPEKRVYSVIELKNGSLLIATDKGAYVLKNGRVSLLHSELINEAISALMEDEEGSLWLGTINKGVFKFHDGEIENLNAEQGLPNNRVLSMLQDIEGSIWIGTNGGLLRLRSAPFTTFTSERQLVGDYVRSVISLDNDTVLAGSSEGLSLIKNNKAQPALDNSATKLSVLSFAKRNQGGAWVGTYLNGLKYWQDNQLFDYLDQNSGLPNNEVRAILEDNQGNLWIGTTNGLVKRDTEGHYQVLGREQGLPDEYIMALARDNRGQLWVGTGVGVAVLNDNGLQNIPIQSQEGAAYAFGFWIEPGFVWITTDRGLIRYRQRDGQLKLIGRSAGLPIDKLFQVVYDGDDGLWLTSNRGIWRISYESAHAVADGKQQTIAFEHFAEDDGLASAQANGGSNPAATSTDNGKVWFATAKGVSTIDSALASQKTALRLPIVIESVSIDGHNIDFTEHNELPASTNRVTINFAGLGYVMSSRIEYRTKLLGFKSDWALRGKNTVAEYTNLAPGDYKFVVSARYPYSDWHNADQIIEFRVLPHFWQRLRVQVAFVLLVIILMVGLMYWRLHSLKQSEVRLKAIIEKQTHTLRQTSEDFQRQANEDELTKLPNRRAFDRLLKEKFEQAKQNNTSLVMVIMDIDHFKKINDNYSHLVGDKVIQALGNELLQLSAPDVHVARWGGEEFTMIIEGLEAEKAFDYCDSIRQRIASIDHSHLSNTLKMTVSMGVAFAHQVGHYEDLIRLADQALYQAKNDGRNCVQLWRTQKNNNRT
ncbi:ligand-binding sensor domain-containing diguanylate cyclase [Marinomonas algarum]|uniref:diguanylate cyclase n=1 Tax=Marinomonas algarum TaxID=2883105 RepID=A0A9X1IMX3_9GAMM|nr:ligand-binding sensor domain-containing diguanylate cyclase [Marinomonas algarum]MCB5162180.1 diguanylate cyclase [Marinomonas algarum]